MKFFRKISDILCIPIVLLMLMALVISDIFKNDKNHYNYKNAWKNEERLFKCFPKDFTKRPDRKKWITILKGVYSLKYHTDPYNNDSAKVTKEFFKRNNIDLYSENFDPEYVAKCIREQEIC